MKKVFKYDFTDKIELLEYLYTSDIEDFGSSVISIINSKVDDETIEIASDLITLKMPYRRIDFTDERVEVTGTIAEATLFNIGSANIGTDTNLNLSLYWSSGSKTIGTLAFIGKDDTNNWELTNNQRVIITAELGSWFNVKNNAGGSVTNATKIITKDTDLFGLSKAVFIYSYSQDVWLIESYEYLSPYSVMTDFGSATFSGGSTEQEQSITVTKAGLYALNCFFMVEETTTGTAVYTQNPQLLYAKEGGGTYITIDQSGYFVLGIGGAPFWYNKSLQGSCFIRVSPSDLTIYSKIYLPNGVTKRRVSGYMHANYIGS